MTEFTLLLDVTERTVEQITIEADNLEEAIKLVEEYNFDNSECQFLRSLEWSAENVRLRS
jgi:hypothetical protein